jgi:antitoxin component YwqK of YwqJK toxin-antitoxin module
VHNGVVEGDSIGYYENGDVHFINKCVNGKLIEAQEF